MSLGLGFGFVHSFSGAKASTYALTSALPTGFTYTRSDSVATYRDSNGDLQVASSNSPRFDHDSSGNALGILFEGTRQNKTTAYNLNPTDLTGLTKSGNATASVAIVNDSANLAAAGLDAGNGNVIEIDNTLGGTGTSIVTIAGQFGNTNPHSMSAYVYNVTGASGFIGDSGGSGVATQTGTGGYLLTKSENHTPSVSTRQMRLNAPIGTKVRFTLFQLEEGTFATSPIVVAGAAATREAEKIAVTSLANISTWNQSQGTIIVNGDFTGNAAATQGIAVFSDNSTNNRIGVRKNSDDYIRNYVFSGGASVSAVSSVKPIISRNFSSGVAWKQSGGLINTYADGYYVAATGESNIPTTALTRLDIGAIHNGSQPMFGHIKSLVVVDKFRTINQIGTYMFNSGWKAQITAGQSLVDNYRRSQIDLNYGGQRGYLEQVDTIRTNAQNYIIHGATSGTSLLQENDAGSGYWVATGGTDGPALTRWKAIVTAALAAGATIDAIIWDQGEADAAALAAGTTTKAEYKDALVALFGTMRTHIGGSPPVIIVPIGRRSDGAANGFQNVREIQKEVDSENAWVYLAPGKIDLQLADETGATDGVHLTDTSYYTQAKNRVARKVMKVLGETVSGGVDGPRVSAVSRSGTSVTVTLTHDTGTDFTPTTGIKGFRFFDNGVEITINAAVRTNATTITLTLASTPTGTETLYYGYGAMEDVTDETVVVKDNATVSLPLRTIGPVTLPYTE